MPESAAIFFCLTIKAAVRAATKPFAKSSAPPRPIRTASFKGGNASYRFSYRFLPSVFGTTRFRSSWFIALLFVGLVSASLVGGTAVAEETHPRHVVFFLPDSLELSLSTAFEEALRAHFADVNVVLTIKRVAVTSFDFREIIEKSKAAVKDDGAVGVFWLDTEELKDWLLYLVDPKTEQALARRVRVPDARESAGVETVAVITSNATSALIDGREVTSQLLDDTKDKLPAISEVTEEFRDVQTLIREESTEKPRLPRDKKNGGINALSAAPPKTPAERPSVSDKPVGARSGQTRESMPEVKSDKRENKDTVSSEPGALGRYLGGHVRIAVAYRGNTFAEESGYRWQNGMGFWAGWITRGGLYGGVGYLLVPEIEVPEENLGPALGKLTIVRHPIEAFFGHHHRNGRFSIYFEAVGIFDLMVRRTGELTALQGQEVEIIRKANNSRLVLGLSGRFMVEYTVIGDIAVFAGFAVEYYFGNFDYRYKPAIGPEETLFSPKKFRADVEVGLSFHL